MQIDESERDFAVLHTLRCIGFSSEDRIASAAGRETAEVVAILRALAARGLVTEHEGVFGGWVMTDRGRVADDELLAAELSGNGAQAAVEEAYDAFNGLNTLLLKVCHDWQLRGVNGARFPNDHSDDAYDAGVIDRLVRVDAAVQPLLDTLTGLLPRFAIHRDRLTFALERVLAGDHEYFTDGLDSYHTAWFQLHEDLLTTLGIERDPGGDTPTDER